MTRPHLYYLFPTESNFLPARRKNCWLTSIRCYHVWHQPLIHHVTPHDHSSPNTVLHKNSSWSHLTYSIPDLRYLFLWLSSRNTQTPPDLIIGPEVGASLSQSFGNGSLLGYCGTLGRPQYRRLTCDRHHTARDHSP